MAAQFAVYGAGAVGATPPAKFVVEYAKVYGATPSAAQFVVHQAFVLGNELTPHFAIYDQHVIGVPTVQAHFAMYDAEVTGIRYNGTGIFAIESAGVYGQNPVASPDWIFIRQGGAWVPVKMYVRHLGDWLQLT